jgi:hypothetical protein
MITILKTIDRYNSTAEYLTKKNGNTYDLLNYKNADKHMDTYINRCKLKTQQIDKIRHHLKKTQDLTIQLTNIIKNPFDFIRQDFQLITYEKAEKICVIYSLTIDIKIKAEKYAYHLFLKEKTFYLPNWIFKKHMEDFCRERGENYTRLTIHLNNFIIEKE